MMVRQSVAQIHPKRATIVHKMQQISVKWGQVENCSNLKIREGQSDLFQRFENNRVDLTVSHGVVDWGPSEGNCVLQLQWRVSPFCHRGHGGEFGGNLCES